MLRYLIEFIFAAAQQFHVILNETLCEFCDPLYTIENPKPQLTMGYISLVGLG
jgi:hypothetical protein